MDSFATKEGAIPLTPANRVSARSTRKSKGKIPNPKKLTESLIARTQQKKLGIGVLEVHKELTKEIFTFFNYFKPENREKNAKPDQVFLYDYNRVVLSGDSNYYHASIVDGCFRNGMYVLAQAPFNEDTGIDFYRMVRQLKPDAIIIMSSSEDEDSKFILKSDKYGSIIVKVGEIEEKPKAKVNDGLEIRTLQIGKDKVKVFNITGWNVDKDVPKTLTEAHEKIRKCITWDNKGVLILVCKDGATRCGIFTLLDMETDRLKQRGRLKLTDSIRAIRSQRSHTFETAEIFESALTLIVDLAKKNANV